MVDLLWVLLCTGLVFLMQAGFMCVESGLTRSKNSINVVVKNMADFGLSVALFWGFGFALMFGASQSGWIGGSHFFPAAASPKFVAFFLFQAMFCGTATTIISGAVAERLKFSAYVVIVMLVSGLIYPLFGHWAWNSLLEENSGGWLGNLGFVDFAGSTVVHSVGAWVSLATLAIVGARQGRFSSEGKPHKIQGSNLPFSMLGALLLWFGWIGFNGGSTLALNDQVPGIILNTILAGVAGMITAAVLSWLQHRLLEVELLINGILAGLVAVTACCDVISTPLAFLVGSTGAAVALLVSYGLRRVRIDDAVDAVAVHGGAGAWGTLCVALFGQLENVNRISQLSIQLLGIGVCFAWAFGLSWLTLKAANHFFPLRVTEEDEIMGLNISEHHAKTDTYDLFQVMDYQAKTSDLSLRVPVEPFTEVGHIATRYNQVMDSLAQNHDENIDTLEQIFTLTAAAEAVIESNRFEPDALELDGMCDRNDELGSLARVLQQLVAAVYQREQVLVKAQLDSSANNGFASGLQDAQRVAIIEILTARFGSIPATVSKQLSHITDADQLETLLKLSASAASLSVFQQQMTELSA